jgi:putative membrane protein
MKFVIQILISTLAVLATAYLLPGVKVDTVWTAIIVAAVLAFLNAVVKPILIVLTIPVTIFSLGIFLLVINALMIMLADKLVDGFAVRSFWTALVFSIVLWIITSIFESIGKNDNRNRNRNNHPY